MSLLAPFGLLLALATALVLLLHMRRRRTVNMPSLAIWRRIHLGQQRRSRTLQWPHLTWPLALQLLAVLVVALALAQPVLNGAERVDHWVFVVDHSGAMRASGASGELLAEAKEQLSSRIAGGTGGERISIVAVGNYVRPVVARQSTDTPGLADAVESITPQDGAADWGDVAPVVRSLLQPGERSAVVVYSDRPVTPANLPTDTVIETVAMAPATSADAALTATLAADPAQANKWTLDASVSLQGGLAGTDVIVGYAADRLASELEWTRKTVGKPGTEAAPEPLTRDVSFDLELPGPGVVSISTSGDANPSNDRSWFVTRSEALPIRVLYIGEGNQPLLTALKVVDGTEIYQAEGLPAQLSQFDLVVVDNRHVARAPETNVLWIGDAGVGDSALAAGAAAMPTSASSNHPLLAGVDWADIVVEQSFTPPETDGRTLLAANGKPLITEAGDENGQSVRLLFDPRKSTWARQSSLPVFVANLVDWLGLRAEGTVAAGCVVGERCNLDARLAGGTITRLDVPGEPATLHSARFVPNSIGLYRLVNGARTRLLAVNPAAAPAAAPGGAAAVNLADFPKAIWPWLFGALFIILVIEAIISGRGSDRFLHLSALTDASPLKLRRRAALALRVLTLTLVGLAIFNVHVLLPHSGETIVNVAAAGAAPNVGVIAAPQAGIASAPTTPQRDGSGSDAIALAAATVPWGEPGRILVEGDVAMSEPEALGLAAPLAVRDLSVDAAPVAAGNATDVKVTAIEAPSPVYEGDTFPLTGIVRSTMATQATITFSRDGLTLVDQAVSLQAGDNRIDTLVPDVAGGSADYELRVASADDAVAENNSFHRTIVARLPGKIAVVSADAEQGAAFAGWLGTQGLVAEVVEPVKAPYKLSDWRAYDGAVLLDVPAIALTTQQQELLRSAVADEGLGLLILGGPNAFGPGGYLETPLDDLSPLSSKVPRDMPEATLVFVLDRSGSMQQLVGNETRLDVAKTATLSAVKLLNRQSRVGVVVFDSEPTTVFPLQKLDNPDAVGIALSSVDPGGGTSIYPGLKNAFDMLSGVDSPARHIVVMTDGLTQPADFAGLLGQIRAAGITVSSVSIGKGAERDLVAQIAKLGNGTFHATEDFSALPSILSQEAMLLSGSPIEEHDAQPLWASRAEPFLRGLPASMPPIHGFVLTTPKPEATLSMAVPDSKGEAMPLLASWRFGNGSVLALSTDAAGPWSADWQQVDSYPALWSQALRQFLPPVDRGDVALSLAAKGDGVLATVSLAGKAAGAAPNLTVGAAGTRTPVSLHPVTANRFEGVFYPEEPGAFLFNATAGESSASAGWSANYPAYLRGGSGEDGLGALVAATGGGSSPGGNAGTAGDLRWVEHSAWPIWAVAALALLLVELVVRYTSLLRATPMPAGAADPMPRRATRLASETVDA